MAEYISLQTTFILIWMFWSLNCNINGHHRKYFSVDIAFYNYYVQMYSEPIISSVVKNSKNWIFFRDLVDRGSHWCFVIFTGKQLCQGLFLSCNFIIKETLAQGFSCEFCKTFKDTFLTDLHWMTTSILQQLPAFYFAIIYSWQLSSSEKSLSGEKNCHLDLFSFSLTNPGLPCQLRKAYAILWTANCFVGSETPKHWFWPTLKL